MQVKKLKCLIVNVSMQGQKALLVDHIKVTIILRSPVSKLLLSSQSKSVIMPCGSRV
jgi:hypothetical protein